ncbi:hypothetical protein [Ureibacillus sp. FSL K6-2830]|uniref:hypothetical protein n=1 Tax=Ureibacillus sp. FSL K6-2830 TaxID=2954610 RepID=UPI0030FC8B5F
MHEQRVFVRLYAQARKVNAQAEWLYARAKKVNAQGSGLCARAESICMTMCTS